MLRFRPSLFARCSSPLGLALVVGAVGCSSSGSNGVIGGAPDGSTTDGSLGDGALEAGDDTAVHFDVSTATLTTIAVDPSSSTMTVTDPTAPPTVALTAMGTFSDGTKRSVAASWSSDRIDIADVVAATGEVKPTGKTGGVVTISATVDSFTATATVTVDLKLSFDLGGATPSVGAAARDALRAATAADPAVTKLLYPYDGTVFPKGLAGPEVMWNGGAAGDAYRLSLKGAHVDVEVFGHADPPSVLAIDDALWTLLTTTVATGGATGDVAVELRRRAADGTTAVSASQTWRLADANLRGTIYYWAVDKGQIVRIKPGAKTPETFFDAGPSDSLGTPAAAGYDGTVPPWEAASDGKRCVACHAVSRDGTRLSAQFERKGSTPSPLGFVDLKAGAISALGAYTQNFVFSALTPNGLKSVGNDSSFGVHLFDATTGAALPTALDSIAFKAADPAFANDTTKLALASVTTGGYPVEYSQAGLVTFDFADATNAFTNLQTLITSTGPGDAVAWPSFSPDSKWIFFQRGDYSRAKYASNQHGVDDLYVISATPGAAPIALSALNSAGLVGDNVHLNYQPTVNPVSLGGYFWVVFVSPRDYGNQMVSPQGVAPSDCSYSNRKQLWVAAVDANMKAIDPSHPAFRLPGQALATINMNGYWTLEACKPTPTDGTKASCTAGFECCSGFCRDLDGKGPSCVAPPSGCHRTSESCATDGDCCGDGKCVGGFCAQVGPH